MEEEQYKKFLKEGVELQIRINKLESKNTTKKVQSSTSSRTKIIKWNYKENYLFGD